MELPVLYVEAMNGRYATLPPRFSYWYTAKMPQYYHHTNTATTDTAPTSTLPHFHNIATNTATHTTTTLPQHL